MTMVGTLLLAAALAAPAPKLVMPEWSKVEVSAELAAFYADHLAQALRTQQVQVVTAQEMGALLGLERQKQLLGCNDSSSSCIAELGNALGCDAVLLVSLAKLDDTFRVNLKVVSSSDGSIKVETSGEASSQKKLLDVLEDAAERLASGLREKAPATAGEVRQGSDMRQGGVVRRRAWIPAAVGAVFAVVGIIGTVGAGNRWSELNSQPTPSRYDNSAVIANSGKAWQATAWVSFALATACFATSALMYLLGGEKPVQPTVLVSPTGASFGLAGWWP